jgi:hypothetical protein
MPLSHAEALGAPWREQRFHPLLRQQAQGSSHRYLSFRLARQRIDALLGPTSLADRVSRHTTMCGTRASATVDPGVRLCCAQVTQRFGSESATRLWCALLAPCSALRSVDARLRTLTHRRNLVLSPGGIGAAGLICESPRDSTHQGLPLRPALVAVSLHSAHRSALHSAEAPFCAVAATQRLVL